MSLPPSGPRRFSAPSPADPDYQGPDVVPRVARSETSGHQSEPADLPAVRAVPAAVLGRLLVSVGRAVQMDRPSQVRLRAVDALGFGAFRSLSRSGPKIATLGLLAIVFAGMMRGVLAIGVWVVIFAAWAVMAGVLFRNRSRLRWSRLLLLGPRKRPPPTPADP